MPDERMEIFPTCIECTSQSKYTSFMSYGHKTAGEVVILRDNDPEKKRQLSNAYKRKR